MDNTFRNTSLNLEFFAKEIRLSLLEQLYNRGFGHYGGSLSIVEVLAVVYGKWIRNTVGKPNINEDDWFILSKGHGGPALYSVLALQGYISKNSLLTLNDNGTMLPSHPDKNLTPGIQMTTGSLGQGVSVAVGLAKGIKGDGKDARVFTIVGDGELNEGQCWEAISFAAHHKLDNLIIFVDNNKRQLDGLTVDISNPFDFVEKMTAFGCDAQEVAGNDVNLIDAAIAKAYATPGKPHIIILDTIKGQGVSYLENLFDNHHLRPTQADEDAIKEAIAILRKQTGKDEIGGCEHD
ncbi:transketolase [Erysipelotrichaceae bacterium]|nr:transketolase [Erysipelotrichaceae bacterium]